MMIARTDTIDALCLEVKLSRKGEPPRRRDDRKGQPEIRLRLKTELPPDIFAEWELLKKRLQAESNQPLAEWECLAAVMELARGALDKGGDSTSGESEVVVIHAGDRECDCEGGCDCHGNGPAATLETEDA